MSSTISSGSERSLFLGPRIPNHTKSLNRLLQNINRNIFRQLLKLAVQDFEGKQVNPQRYLAIKDASDDNCEIDVIYGALLYLLKCALSFPGGTLKPDIFKEDLRELKITDDYIEDLSNVVYGSRCSANVDDSKCIIPRFSKLEILRWRVDVAISTSSLSRVLEPTLIMELKLINGQKEIFEVTPSQFHRLRFAVAALLKEIECLEMRNVLKS
ncbi:COMM domain-containing protein 5 [Parasteatoda tepidariorum]|uniref:COMM domain-containing protein 5 n=1 Tax=Parasteatoda tepidariorum TaxID=114398 RepID=UPI00077FA5AB|nr:COMM domain-containing protein 5 [Parasteatoda tepidariorum]